MNEDSIMNASQLISRVVQNIEQGMINNGNNIVNAWRKTIESINPDGMRLASHSQVIDFKNGLLLIETDHPGWIQMLKIHEKYIITGLNRQLKELKISNIAYRVAGVSKTITSQEELREKEQQLMIQVLNEQEKKLEKYSKPVEKTADKKELPESLKDVFARMKSDMLTNGE